LIDSVAISEEKNRSIMSLDTEYESSDGFVDECTVEDDEISLDDLLRNKLDRIIELELDNSKKDKELAKMRRTVVATEVKGKKEVYLLKLELDTCRREKDASEERLAEIYEDLHHLVQPETKTEESELQEATEKYQQFVSIHDNQLQMVQTSCGEVIKTLKEEIADLMEDRHRMELGLLNQLSSLDEEKRETEAYLMRRIEKKEESIEMLRRRGRDGQSLYSGDVEELENEISTLLLEKKNLEEALALEQEKSDEEIKYLEHSNNILEEKVQALAIDVAVLRSRNDGTKTVDTIVKKEEELGSFIDKVAEIREQTNRSVQKLSQTIDKVKSDVSVEASEVGVNEDGERLLSTLESASLVHDQVQLSVRLIELQLQNRLKSVRNEKFGTKVTAAKDTILVHKMNEIQEDTMEAISKIEGVLSQQIRHQGGKTLDELHRIKAVLEKRTEALRRIQSDNNELQQEIAKLKATHMTRKDASREEEKTSDTETISVSKHTIDQLEIETLRVVDTVKMKNETITTLSNELSRHKIREKELKAQLDRFSAFPPTTLTIGGKNTKLNTMSTGAATLPRSPEEERRTDRTTMPKGGSTMMIAPLRPSSREVFRHNLTV
jgi:hypothetical protein